MAAGTIDIPLYPHQSAALLSEEPVVLLLGDGGGKSTTIRVVALQYAINHPGIKIALIGPESSDLLWTHLEGANGLRAILGKTKAAKFEPGAIKFANGSEIILVGTDQPSDLRRLGETTIQVALLDDADLIAPNLITAIDKAAKSRIIAASAGNGTSQALIERLKPGLTLRFSADLLPRDFADRNLFNETSTERNREERAAFADDPAGYIETVIGGTIAPVVDGIKYDTLLKALEIMQSEPFVLIPGHHGAGKDWILSRYALHHHDSVGSQLDESGVESGSRTVLIGPTAKSIFQTTYMGVLEAAAAAERRGYPMLPGRSNKQPYWSPREQWVMEGLSPQHSAGQGMAHSASGRHHRYLLWVLGEASGIRSAAIQSAIGSASGKGNRIICIFNPDRSDSAISKLMRGSTFRTISLSALDHVNVRTRRDIIPGAVSHGFVDAKVRECVRLGDYPEVLPDPLRNEFVYALPSKDGIEGGGPREDGHPGHVDGDLATWRPTGLFEPQVLGLLPHQDSSKLFREDAWDAAVLRWKKASDPDSAPEMVGLDCAREGDDDTVGAPRWGPDAVELLTQWVELSAAGNADALAALGGRTRIGALRVMPKGDGPTVAFATYRHWPASPWNVDDGSVGVSVYDNAVKQLGVTAYPVTFGAPAPARIDGQPFHADNVRAAMHFVAATSVNLGLVDVPPDPLLREEALSIWTIPRGEKIVEIKPGVRKPVSVRGLPPKRSRPGSNETSIHQVIGRSPDRLDAFVLALWRSAIRVPGGVVQLPPIFF